MLENINICDESGVYQVVIEIAGEEEILDMDRGGGVEEGIAKYAADAPHVLAFEVGAVAIAVHFGGEYVFAFLEELGDIEFGGGCGCPGCSRLFCR